jgi:dihydrofolate reductase
MINNLSIIVALDEAGGFAKDYQIPWKNETFAKEDMKHFRELTQGNVVLMGRHTYEEIHEKKMERGHELDSPLLPGRTSFVLSRQEEFQPHGAKKIGWYRGLLYHDEILDETIKQKLFVLGGEKLFIEVLPDVSDVYCTIVKGIYNCDKFFLIKELTNKFEIVDGKETDQTYFVHYVRKIR